MLKYVYNQLIFEKNSQKQHFDRLPCDLPENCLAHETKDLEMLVFAPSPVSHLPNSDLSLVLHGGLSPEMLNLIQSLTMRHQIPQSKGFDSDQDALFGCIPYQLDNETVLLQYYKNLGYDDEKLQRVLDGEDISEVFSSDGSSLDDTSSE